MELTLFAGAKVNLDLRIVGSRSDGYHLIDSLVVPIALHDTVRIRCSAGRGITVRSSDPTLACGKRNLAWGAAALALELGKASARVEIDLTKRIPVGAGLGGGSADAAAVLLGLNSLLDLKLSRHRIASSAAALGADVPFFVHGRPAVVSGVGEKIRVLKEFRRRWLVIAWPRFAISTKRLYVLYDRSLTKTNPVPMIGRSVKGRGPSRRISTNDLEAVAVAAHPALRSLKGQLLALGAVSSRMTGSGSAFFGLFQSRNKARQGAAVLRRAGVWAEAVHTIEHALSTEAP